MKRFHVVQYFAATIASLGLVLPAGVQAAQPGQAPADAHAAPAQPILDVSLGEQGTLSGQLLDAGGVGVSHTPVTVRSVDREVGRTTTGEDGKFAVRGLSGGVYTVTAGDASGVYRLWTASTSPPSANRSILVVVGDPVARGQYPGQYTPFRPVGCYRRYLTNGDVVKIVGLGALAGGIVAIAVSNEHPSGS